MPGRFPFRTSDFARTPFLSPAEPAPEAKSSETEASDRRAADLARSPTMVDFQDRVKASTKWYRELVARTRAVSAELGHYLMQWNPFAMVVSYLMAGGGFALAVAFIPEKISPALYTFAEVLFVVSVLFFAGKCIYDFRSHNERYLTRWFVTIAFAPILITIVALFEWNRPQQAALPSGIAQRQDAPVVKRFLLTPGLHPTPPGPNCTGDAITPLSVKKGEIAVFMGGSVVITKGTGTVILSISGENVLSFRRASSELHLYAILRDAPGSEIGRVTENVVTLRAVGYEALHPDAHNLAIINSQGRRVLSVRYVNEFSIVVSGDFFGKTAGQILVSDHGIDIPGINLASGQMCFSQLEGPLISLEANQFRFGR